MLFYNIQYNHHHFHMEYFEYDYSFFIICFNILFKNIKFIIDMFDSLYTFYNVWYVYNIILHIHGIYLAYNFFMWTMATSYTYLAYMLTFFYIAQPVEQLENKKD